MSEYRDKLRSLAFSSALRETPRVTTDELGHTTTEHWNDRVDVTINAPTLCISSQLEER